jgi:hypothetical protein
MLARLRHGLMMNATNGGHLCGRDYLCGSWRSTDNPHIRGRESQSCSGGLATVPLRGTKCKDDRRNAPLRSRQPHTLALLCSGYLFELVG